MTDCIESIGGRITHSMIGIHLSRTKCHIATAPLERLSGSDRFSVHAKPFQWMLSRRCDCRYLSVVLNVSSVDVVLSWLLEMES